MYCLIVDDHPLTSVGIATTIGIEHPALKVIMKSKVCEVVEFLDQNADLPGLILLDLHLPVGHGSDVLRHIKQIGSLALPIVVSGVDDHATINECRELGARGFIAKSEALNCIGDAVSRVLSGGEFFSVASPETENSEFKVVAEKLQSRMRDVLDLLLAGHSNVEIAQTLGISPGTVKNYVADLFVLFHAKSRTQIVAASRGSRYKPKLAA